MQEPKDLKALYISQISDTHKLLGWFWAACLPTMATHLAVISKSSDCVIFILCQGWSLDLKEKVIESEGASLHTQDHFFCFSIVSKNGFNWAVASFGQCSSISSSFLVGTQPRKRRQGFIVENCQVWGLEAIKFLFLCEVLEPFSPSCSVMPTLVSRETLQMEFCKAEREARWWSGLCKVGWTSSQASGAHGRWLRADVCATAPCHLGEEASWFLSNVSFEEGTGRQLRSDSSSFGLFFLCPHHSFTSNNIERQYRWGTFFHHSKVGWKNSKLYNVFTLIYCGSQLPGDMSSFYLR